MKGLFGVMLIALGIFIAVMGGFLLNAENVTTCETDWEYMTDVGGAFRGDDSDMDVEYDPPANLTGWNAFDEYNDGWISGVGYEPTDATNLYRASVGTRSYTAYSLGWSAEDYSGTALEPEYRLSLGTGSFAGTMEEGFGIHSSEAVTVFQYGSTVRYGAFAAPLPMISVIIPGYEGLNTLELSVNGSSSGYPCFAIVEKSTYMGQYTHNGSSYNASMSMNLATVHSTTISINIETGTAFMADKSVPLEEVLVVWGQAQFNGTGDYTLSASVSGTGTIEAERVFLDAAEGVTVRQGTVYWNDMQYTAFDGSSSPSMDMGFEAIHNEDSCLGTISYVPVGSDTPVDVATYTFVGASNTSIVTLTPSGGAEHSETVSGVSTGSISMSMANSVMTFSLNGSEACTVAVSASIKSLTVTTESLGAGLASYTITITKDDDTSEVFSGDSEGEHTASLGYVIYEPTQHQQSYTTSYWYNRQHNASVTLVLKAVAFPSSVSIQFRGSDGDTTVEAACSVSKVWTVGGVTMGDWDAIELTAGYGAVVARPVSRFVSFTDYDAVDDPRTVVASGFVGGAVVDSMAVSAGSSGLYLMKLSVTSTTARIYNGGLYLQDASLNLLALFPDSKAVSVMIGSTAAMGDSITFTSVSDSSVTVTIPVDPSKGAYILGKWRPFNGIRFMWVSPNMDPQTIDGSVYSAAIYYRGGVYEAGKLWVSLRDGSMVELMDADDGWTMKLDGVWAPSVFLYTGNNVASSTVQIADFTDPEFKWNMQDFILVMMGVSIAGGFLGTYFRVVDTWDWVAIIGTIGALWLFLG